MEEPTVEAVEAEASKTSAIGKFRRSSQRAARHSVLWTLRPALSERAQDAPEPTRSSRISKSFRRAAAANALARNPGTQRQGTSPSFSPQSTSSFSVRSRSDTLAKARTRSTIADISDDNGKGRLTSLVNRAKGKLSLVRGLRSPMGKDAQTDSSSRRGPDASDVAKHVQSLDAVCPAIAVSIGDKLYAAASMSGLVNTYSVETAELVDSFVVQAAPAINALVFLRPPGATLDDQVCCVLWRMSSPEAFAPPTPSPHAHWDWPRRPGAPRGHLMATSRPRWQLLASDGTSAPLMAPPRLRWHLLASDGTSAPLMAPPRPLDQVLCVGTHNGQVLMRHVARRTTEAVHHFGEAPSLSRAGVGGVRSEVSHGESEADGSPTTARAGGVDGVATASAPAGAPADALVEESSALPPPPRARGGGGGGGGGGAQPKGSVARPHVHALSASRLPAERVPGASARSVLLAVGGRLPQGSDYIEVRGPTPLPVDFEGLPRPLVRPAMLCME